jgi:hypothetical protein
MLMPSTLRRGSGAELLGAAALAPPLLSAVAHQARSRSTMRCWARSWRRSSSKGVRANGCSSSRMPSRFGRLAAMAGVCEVRSGAV